MIITDLGPGKGLHIGKTLFSINSSNSAAVYDPCLISQVIKPFTVYAGRIDQRSERWRDLISCGVLPTGAQPYFLSAVLSFAADSSRNMSCSAVQSASFHIHMPLSSGFRCAALICIYRLEFQEEN